MWSRRRLMVLGLWLLPNLVLAAAPPSLLDVTVNGVETHQVVVATKEGADLWLSSSDWTTIGVVLTPSEATHDKWSARDLNVGFEVDEATQSVRLKVPPARLPKQSLEDPNRLSMPKLSAPAHGLLLNYDISTVYDGSNTALSLGHEVRWNVGGGMVSTQGQLNERLGQWDYRRLYTTWTRNNYDNLHITQIGDVFATSLMGNTTNLAGVRFAKDPSLNPFVPSYPLPTINGIVVDPGTLVVLSDASVVSRLAVQQGPFSLSPYQLRNGVNQLTTVLTDGLGRQQVVGQTDFYATPQLLRDGLTTWDGAVGLTREGLTDAYGTPAASLTLSHGFGWLTGTVGSQVSQEGQNVMLGTQTRLGQAGVLTTQMGLSTQAQGMGWAYQVRWDYASKAWTAYVLHRQEHHFYQLGNPLLSRFRPSEETRAGVMWRSPNNTWQTTLAYNGFTVDHIQSRKVDATVQWTHGRHSVSVDAGYDLNHHAPQIYVGYRYSFGRGSVSASAQNEFGASFRADLAQHYGSNVSSNTRVTLDDTRAGQYISAQTDVYTPNTQTEVTVNHGPTGTLVSGRVLGSVYIGDGAVKPIALSQDSWLRVMVPGVPHVRVSLGGRYVGKTDQQGVLVVGQVPSLTPLMVSLDPKDIPFGVELHEMDRSVAAPKRQGIDVVFVVATQDARSFELVDAHGVDLPMGSQTTDGQLVGYQGQLFLEHPKAGTPMKVLLPSGSSCALEIPKPLPAYGMNIKLTCAE